MTPDPPPPDATAPDAAMAHPPTFDGTAAGLVTVWLVRTEAPAATVTELAALLDDEERDRARRLGPVAGRRFAVSHGAARLIVGRCLGVAPDRIRWARGRYGKPALAGTAAGLEVNLSHADDLTAVALSRGRPVGVDVQRVLPGLDSAAMSRRYFPPADARFVTGADDPAERSDRFTRLWARKEACVKAVGGRLVDGLRMPVHRPGDVTDRPRARAHERLRRGGARNLSTPPGQRALLVGGGDGTPAIRVRDLPAPPDVRAAVALLGSTPFETAVRWWRPEAW